MHVSTICDDIVQTLYPRKPLAFADETRLAFQELGSAVEDVISDAIKARYASWEKPSPRQDRRGVWGSPDGWHQKSRTIHEIKATWASERNFVEIVDGRIVSESPKFYRYRIQSLKYGSMWRAARTCIHVVFVVGTERPPFPFPRSYTLVPTAEEYSTNDNLLWQHSEDRGWL